MPHRPIGIFDSGLGGISVLKEIHQQLPNEDLIYVADSANAPYGDKDRASIQNRCETVTRFLLEHDVKSVVIACNTATAIAAEYLRQQFSDIAIIGLEPAVKPAAELTKAGRIGILATEQTIKSERLAGLIEDYAKNVKTETQACSGLVEQVEQGDFDSEQTRKLLKQYLSPMLEKGIDTLVLGCTHYPFLMDEIKRLTNHSVQILETSIPVTQQLIRMITPKLINSSQHQGSIEFYSSENDQQHKQQMQTLWQGGDIVVRQMPAPFC